MVAVRFPSCLEVGATAESTTASQPAAESSPLVFSFDPATANCKAFRFARQNLMVKSLLSDQHAVSVIPTIHSSNQIQPCKFALRIESAPRKNRKWDVLIRLATVLTEQEILVYKVRTGEVKLPFLGTVVHRLERFVGDTVSVSFKPGTVMPDGSQDVFLAASIDGVEVEKEMRVLQAITEDISITVLTMRAGVSVSILKHR